MASLLESIPMLGNLGHNESQRTLNGYMSCDARKPVFGVSDQMNKTGLYSHRRWLEAGNFGFRKNRNCTIPVAKTKALISCAVTAQLIGAFVFALAKIWFSHDAAHMSKMCVCF